MDVTRTDKVILEIGESPLAAIEIEIDGVTVLVDVHNKVVTVFGHRHVHHGTGEHDTLMVHAESKRPPSHMGLMVGDIPPGLFVTEEQWVGRTLEDFDGPYGKRSWREHLTDDFRRIPIAVHRLDDLRDLSVSFEDVPCLRKRSMNPGL